MKNLFITLFGENWKTTLGGYAKATMTVATTYITTTEVPALSKLWWTGLLAAVLQVIQGYNTAQPKTPAAVLSTVLNEAKDQGLHNTVANVMLAPTVTSNGVTSLKNLDVTKP